MNRQEHLKLLEEKMKRNLDIARKKNNDYCGEGVDADPFANFRGSEKFGVSVEKGILVRMSDKMARIGTLLNQEAQVKDESIQDALADLSNYALILSNYLDSKKEYSTVELNVYTDHGITTKPNNFIGINDYVKITDEKAPYCGCHGKVLDVYDDENTNVTTFVVKINKDHILYSRDQLCKI